MASYEEPEHEDDFAVECEAGKVNIDGREQVGPYCSKQIAETRYDEYYAYELWNVARTVNKVANEEEVDSKEQEAEVPMVFKGAEVNHSQGIYLVCRHQCAVFRSGD